MHDRNGKPLSVGDRVIVEFRIDEAALTTDYCNIKCQTVEPMYPGDSYNTMWLNAKQVEKKDG